MNGLCECGCGGRTSISRDTDPRRGRVKGQPMRFIQGHWMKTQPRTPLPERFWPKVQRGEADECWLWTGYVRPCGYGQFNIASGRSVHAHRFAYEDLVGPIPEGLDLDHLCRTPLCVNPNHLDPVTRSENVRRAHRARSIEQGANA